MKSIEVITQNDLKRWNNVPYPIYKDYPLWVPTLQSEEEKTFNKTTNPYYKKGDCKRWILVDDNNLLLGRIAAFWSNKGSKTNALNKMCGIGFFECIDSQLVANCLFDVAKQWLVSQGMKFMDGVINFGERERFWGVLVHGFDKSPNFCCNYHPPYYQNLFENYGFEVYFNQFTFGKAWTKEVDESLEKKALRIFDRTDYVFKHISKNNLTQVAKDLMYIYNHAWVKINTPKLKLSEAKALVYSLKPILDEQLIWFGYNNNQPIAMFACIPDINPIVKKINGQLNWLGKLKFLYYLRLKPLVNKSVGIIFGIHPDYQKKGIEAAILVSFRNFLIKHNVKYKYFEMNWIGDFNQQMIKVARQLHMQELKKHHTYRYLFNRSVPFQRMPIVN